MQSSKTLLVVPILNCFNIVPEALARVACPSHAAGRVHRWYSSLSSGCPLSARMFL